MIFRYWCLILNRRAIRTFSSISQAIQSKYPELEPFISEPILHVTLARSKEIDRVEKELYDEYGNQLPIHAVGKEVCLYEELENTWHIRTSFSLSN